jgi:hypothetical protein
MKKRIRVIALLLGIAALISLNPISALYWYPNRDDRAARALRRAGAKVRRTPRLLWLSAHSDTEIYPYGDVWDLDLKDITIDGDLADDMASLHSLVHFGIQNCRIQDTSTNVGPPESKLRFVTIAHSNSGDRNIAFLANSANLQFLILEDTEISDASVPTILSCKRLTYIVLKNNKFSQEGIQRIRAGFPRANVQIEQLPTVDH